MRRKQVRQAAERRGKRRIRLPVSLLLLMLEGFKTDRIDYFHALAGEDRVEGAGELGVGRPRTAPRSRRIARPGDLADQARVEVPGARHRRKRCSAIFPRLRDGQAACGRQTPRLLFAAASKARNGSSRLAKRPARSPAFPTDTLRGGRRDSSTRRTTAAPFVTSQPGSGRSRWFRSHGSAAHPGSAAWRVPPRRRPAGRIPVRSPRRGSSGPRPLSPGP